MTERCVMRLEREGVTVTEIAPGVDLERDILAQAEFPLRVANDFRKMDAGALSPGALSICSFARRRETLQ